MHTFCYFLALAFAVEASAFLGPLPLRIRTIASYGRGKEPRSFGFVPRQCRARLDHLMSAGQGQDMQYAQTLKRELEEELPQLFDPSYTPKWNLYAEEVLFIDPLNKFQGIQKYKDNIQMLKGSALFTGARMDLHDARVIDYATVVTTWTLAMTFKAFPWQPVRPPHAIQLIPTRPVPTNCTAGSANSASAHASPAAVARRTLPRGGIRCSSRGRGSGA
jgi:hypothetical protein